jgi:carbamoyl-phosphate synthase large subunit
MLYKLRVPNPERFIVMRQAFDEGLGVDELYELTKVDRWWLVQLKEVWEQQVWLKYVWEQQVWCFSSS